MRTAVVLLAFAAGCGDNHAGGAGDETCAASFAGNFADEASGSAVCAALDQLPGSADQLLDFAIDSRVLGAQVIISVDLGTAPSTGEYSSETLASWHAVGARSLQDGACVYSAGDQVTPHGSFTLSLTAIDEAAAHGTLVVTQYVHAVDEVDCGDADIETVDVVF